MHIGRILVDNSGVVGYIRIKEYISQKLIFISTFVFFMPLAYGNAFQWKFGRVDSYLYSTLSDHYYLSVKWIDESS
jgi:hypothetical protein